MINAIPLIRTRKLTVDFNKSNNSQCTGLVGSFEVVVLNSSAGRDLKCVYTSLGGRTGASFMAQGKNLPSHPRLSALWCVLGLRTFLRHRYKTRDNARLEHSLPCSLLKPSSMKTHRQTNNTTYFV